MVRDYDTHILVVVWCGKTAATYQIIPSTGIDAVKLKIMSDFNINPSNFNLHKYDTSYSEYYDILRPHCSGTVSEHCSKELIIECPNKYKKIASFIVVQKNRPDEFDELSREIASYNCR